VTLWAITDHNQINVLAVTRCWREMNLLHNVPPAHPQSGSARKRIIEQRNHRLAQQ